LKPLSKFGKAVQDLEAGAASAPLWSMLAWQEIRLRYRRSTLGPLWLTVSAGVLIAGMGPLYGKLFGQDLGTYFPYLAISYVLWILLSSLINESCTIFIAAEGLIKQVRLPLTLHVFRHTWKNVLVFFHHALILAVVLIIFPPPISWHLLLVPVGIAVIAVNGIWVGIILATLCARFRDVPQIVQSVVQVLFFLTPVLWRPESLGRYQWAGDWNPLNAFLEIVRAPLLGKAFPGGAWIGVLLITTFGFALALMLFARYRGRIAYWV
jgi:ABC-type polysaccharide/polyol phosphate export permease